PRGTMLAVWIVNPWWCKTRACPASWTATTQRGSDVGSFICAPQSIDRVPRVRSSNAADVSLTGPGSPCNRSDPPDRGRRHEPWVRWAVPSVGFLVVGVTGPRTAGAAASVDAASATPDGGRFGRYCGKRG